MRCAHRALEHCALPACSLAHPPPPCVPPQCTGARPSERTARGWPSAQGRRAHPGACCAHVPASNALPSPARAAPCPPRPRLALRAAPRQPLDPCTLACALTPCSSMRCARAAAVHQDRRHPRDRRRHHRRHRRHHRHHRHRGHRHHRQRGRQPRTPPPASPPAPSPPASPPPPAPQPAPWGRLLRGRSCSAAARAPRNLAQSAHAISRNLVCACM